MTSLPMVTFDLPHVGQKSRYFGSANNTLQAGYAFQQNALRREGSVFFRLFLCHCARRYGSSFLTAAASGVWPRRADALSLDI
jgi:hypothetical protein